MKKILENVKTHLQIHSSQLTIYSALELWVSY